MNQRVTQYLLWFANEHVNFRSADIKAVANIFNINIKYITEISTIPYCIVELPSEKEALQIASRSISLRSVLELWGQGKSYKELHSSLQNLPKSVTNSYCVKEKSFRLYVETYSKTITHKEKVDRIETFDYLPILGPVNLLNPDVGLYLLEYYGLDPNNTPEEPYQLYFGRWIADGQRSLITKLSLKKRQFLGNTSMDAQLSLLMANQAQVQAGHLVFDPFVGSGSLLVAAAQFGGYVWGGDLDYLMLHGKTRPVRPNQKIRAANECIRSNMVQYSLVSKYLDAIVADASLPLWRSDFKLDAIITDPPYGVREAIEKIGSWKGAEVQPISEEHLPGHIPSKVDYNLQTLIHDLLKFAAKHLEIGGRLVFWLPVYREEYDASSSLPSHECLVLESNCEQVLSAHSSRRLLTMRKVQDLCIESDDIAPKVPFSTALFRDKYFTGRLPLETAAINTK